MLGSGLPDTPPEDSDESDEGEDGRIARTGARFITAMQFRAQIDRGEYVPATLFARCEPTL